MYDIRPTTCNICGSNVVYGRMKDFGIAPFQSGYCYCCTNRSCNAFVGTHKKEPRNALGILADAKTRRLRVDCHNELEKHYITTNGKNFAYYKLSEEMGMKFEECHFGYMTKEQLEKALLIMQNWDNICYQ